MSTRLHRRIVDELGLAYYCSASLEPFVDSGLYEIDGACVHEHVPALVREGIAVLARLRDTPPLQEELDKAQRRYRWDLEASFDDPDAMAGWWGGTELFFGPLDGRGQGRAREEGHTRGGAARGAAAASPRAAHRGVRRHADQEARARGARHRREVQVSERRSGH